MWTNTLKAAAERKGGKTFRARTITLKKYQIPLLLKHERNQRQTVLKVYPSLLVFQCSLLRSERDCCRHTNGTSHSRAGRGAASTPGHCMSLWGGTSSDIKGQPHACHQLFSAGWRAKASYCPPTLTPIYRMNTRLSPSLFSTHLCGLTDLKAHLLTFL